MMEFGNSVAKCFSIFKESQKVKVTNLKMVATNLKKLFKHFDQTYLNPIQFLISELCYSFIL